MDDFNKTRANSVGNGLIDLNQIWVCNIWNMCLPVDKRSPHHADNNILLSNMYVHIKMLFHIIYLLASSSRSFASNSLLGGYFGKLEGSHGSGLEEKNCKK